MNALVANAKSAPALAVIRSLGKKGIEVTGASDSESDFPMFSKYCKKKILLRTKSNEIENRIEELLNIVKSNHFDVFLPVMSENLLLDLSKRKNDFEQYTRLAISSYDALSVLNNKAMVSSLLYELEVTQPETYIVNSESELQSIRRKAAFPLVIKPFRGEGATGVRVITEPEDLVKCYHENIKTYGPTLIQEFIHGTKHSAVFLLNKNSDVRRFFVHRSIREFPISGGPACFSMSIKYDPIHESGLKLLKRVNYSGLVCIEFLIDDKDGKLKIIDINPRFYGALQCAITAGVDFPYLMYKMAMNGDIESDLSYKEGVTCRHLVYEDTKHMISIIRGEKSLKYPLGKTATIINYLNFFRDDSYYFLSLSDPAPAFRKILSSFSSGLKSVHE